MTTGGQQKEDFLLVFSLKVSKLFPERVRIIIIIIQLKYIKTFEIAIFSSVPDCIIPHGVFSKEQLNNKYSADPLVCNKYAEQTHSAVSASSEIQEKRDKEQVPTLHLQVIV